jgi:MtaA/CmuA family methyltransferase
VTSKERIRATLERRKADRIAWVPWVGVHGANLLGMGAKEYLTNADAIVDGLVKAKELYSPDALPVMFDVQMEAEALGCNLEWSDQTPPAVVGHILETVPLEDLTVPGPEQGRYPVAIDAARHAVQEMGKHIDLFALVTGPFTLTLHLAGVNIFTDMFDRPEHVKKIIGFASRVCLQTTRYYLDTGVDVVTVVDSLTSQISLSHFNEFVAPFHADIFNEIRNHGRKSGFFACGDATRNLDAMATIGSDFFGVDENVDLESARRVASERGVAFGGNLPLVTALLFGTPEQNETMAMECLRKGGHEGFFLCPGCDIPFDTPVQNLQAVSKAVKKHG